MITVKTGGNALFYALLQWADSRCFTCFYLPLTLLYMPAPDNAILSRHEESKMINSSKPVGATIAMIMTAALCLPLASQAQQGAQHGQDAGPPRAMPGPPPGMGLHGNSDGLPPFMHGIELSEAQQDKVFAATYAQAPFLREQEKIAFKAHQQLRELASSNVYDDSQAQALARSAAEAMAAISLQRARLEQQLLAVLTPEQRQQVEARRPDGAKRPGLRSR